MRLALASCAILVLAACVEKQGEAVDQSYVKANLLATAPTPKTAVNADLGGKIVYLGADLDRSSLAPGDKLTIVHYWKVVEAPGSEWRVFTHVNGAGKDWLNIDETKMRKGYGPDKWKAGDLVRDEQSVTIPKTWQSPFAALYVGLYKKGGTKVTDRMHVVSGPNDGQERVLVARLPISGAKAPEARPPLAIRKTTAPIEIDGKADEAAWATASATGAFTNAEGAPVGTSGATTAKLLWDDANLYVWFEIEDKQIASQFTKQDDPLWQEDVVELFIDADKNRRGYVELQVNPNGAHFDTWFSGGRGQGRDDSFDSGMKSKVVSDGKVWRVELAIPLAAVKGKDDQMAVSIPPRVGDTWKLNLVRVDKNGDAPIAASGWAQIPYSDFHALDRLMTVQFADENGSVQAAVTPAPAPAPGVPGTQVAPLARPGAPSINPEAIEAARKNAEKQASPGEPR